MGQSDGDSVLNTVAYRFNRRLEKSFPEQRLFLRSEQGTRFVILTPTVQLVAWVVSAAFVAWAIIATAVLLMDSVSSGSVREQSQREQRLYEERLRTLADQRDARQQHTDQRHSKDAAQASGFATFGRWRRGSLRGCRWWGSRWRSARRSGRRGRWAARRRGAPGGSWRWRGWPVLPRWGRWPIRRRRRRRRLVTRVATDRRWGLPTVWEACRGSAKPRIRRPLVGHSKNVRAAGGY
ncbi:DUF5930 domain-containing protein [Mycolicibacterium poriferae]|uniref:DUF5930 domain-containing protein n=1 Tax=Mycolicibacterium poriferae TaxID=39694 RepID=UPI003D2EBD80